jgi:ribosomal-protein-alanine N-acetyltransferase
MIDQRRPYFLRSERLGFGEWSEADVDLAFALWGDPQLMRFIGGPYSREKARARLAREMDSLASFGVQYWPIFLLENDQFIGCCGLRPHGDIHALGFHLLPAFWGRGYAREAAQAAIGYAFGTIGAEVLFAGHHPLNAPSKRVLEALGFVYWRDELYPPTGLMHPSYLLRKPRVS